jgi:hypothetical protein
VHSVKAGQVGQRPDGMTELVCEGGTVGWGHGQHI